MCTAENQFKKGIYIYDLKTDKNYLISGDNEAAAYPGFTEDGRIVYAGFAKGNKGTENSGYHGVFRVDVLKLSSSGKYCTEVSSAKKSEINIKKPADESKTNN